MKRGLLGASLVCAALSGWAWLQEHESAISIPVLASSPPGGTLVASVSLEDPSAVRRVPKPLPAAEIPLGPLLPTAPDPENAQTPSLSPQAAEAIARNYFEAHVQVEELARALPAESESDPRTPERFPAYFAARARRDELSMQLTQIQPPGPEEALPILDLRAQTGDFERIYRNWPRVDLLVEHWRISRAACAESFRLLADRSKNGLYEAKAIEKSFAFG
ncbi:MAG: hypothetical protein ABI054_12140 [Planctomycetota bacterium]